MKRVCTVLLLVAMVVGALLPQTLTAQGPLPDRAPRPVEQAAQPTLFAPEYGGVWAMGPDTTFAFTRFDGEYFPLDGKVYFMGGRLADGNTDGSVWVFDPATGVYTDTGVDLPTPISNYEMNLLQDGNGDWGFYVFCGRPAAGGTSNAVQVYYPISNTAVMLDPADNFPGPGCTSALNVVYENQAYVAGGFDPAQTPSNWDYTYVFSPTAPVGSKWTLLPATLNLARAYIMGAAVDGKIYAIGGNWYDASGSACGQLLCDEPIVEVLDPANPTTWDDAAAADLPQGCSEGRAYGFDSTSPYLDPDGTPMAGKIVSSCGQWPDEQNLVYVYDTALDFWDPFPSLNVDRRDHAASFLPDPDPAMWVWGGRKDSDANVLTSSEYYTLTMPQVACNILLVEDDWDWDTRGGTPYYTSTLDDLGYTYDIWDTESMGSPPSTTLGGYDVVIWFTGYDWEDPISPTVDEPNLIAYLENGGNLFLSDQEQNYAYGMTPLFTDYFWVDLITDDVVLTGTQGGAADPLFAGLGPYPMGRPDQWDVYWPIGSFQGPYDDEVSVKAGGFEPTVYSDTLTPNATRFEGANFKTVYLAYPFEWIVNLEDRAELLGTVLDWFCLYAPPGGMQLIPPGQAGAGIPGEAVPYTLTVVNNLGWDETFTITYNSLWPVTGPSAVGPVPDGRSESFFVTVTVPTDVGCFDTDMVAVTAVAASDPAYSDTAYIETTANPAGTGVVKGTVYDANTSDPIENAYVLLDSAYAYYEAHTDISGTVVFTAVLACDYDPTSYVAAVGYENHFYSLTVEAGVTHTLDFYLDAAWPELSTTAVSVTLPTGTVSTYPLTLTNNGSADLDFYISEIDSGAPYAPAAAQTMPRGVDAQVYADLAASPDGTARFIVYMAEQANLDKAFSIKDRSERGWYVLNTLREVAQRTQAGLLADLERAGVEYEPFYIVNAVTVRGDANLVESIIARPEVAYIGPDVTIPAPEPVGEPVAPESLDAVEWNIAKVGGDQVWQTFGAYGDGIIVANIDTGVEYTHTALVQQYRGTTVITESVYTFTHDYNWWDPYGYGPTEPYDWYGHGSHTIGTMVGSDDPANPISATRVIGLAPHAKWFTCQGFDMATGYGYTVELLECAEFVLAPWDLSGQNPNPDMRADVVNNSWGGGQAQWWYNQVIYAWRAAGMFGTFSAGNAGPGCETVGDPSDMEMVISVGATDINDDIAAFSSRGPAKITGLIKPNVSAPGVAVCSAVPGDAYSCWSGTSMASPHVAGAAALIWSAQPELRGDTQLTYWLLEQTALPLTSTQECGGVPGDQIPNNVYGWGRINVFDAVSMALTYTWDIPWLEVTPVSGTVAPSASTVISLTFDTNGLEANACYSGTLKVQFNDPYSGEVLVPVDLCTAEAVPPTYQIYLPIVTKNYGP